MYKVATPLALDPDAVPFLAKINLSAGLGQV
jgi:hypothetical protein